MAAVQVTGDIPSNETGPAGTEQDIERTAMRLLGAREHSRTELRRKLGRRNFAPDLVDRVLDRMSAGGLLSDARFTEQYVASCRRRGWGPLRVRAGLRERGVNEALVDRWVGADCTSWLELLRDVHDRKYGPALPASMREMARRARFLRYRGFDGEQVQRFLSRDDAG